MSTTIKNEDAIKDETDISTDHHPTTMSTAIIKDETDISGDWLHTAEECAKRGFHYFVIPAPTCTECSGSIKVGETVFKGVDGSIYHPTGRCTRTRTPTETTRPDLSSISTERSTRESDLTHGSFHYPEAISRKNMITKYGDEVKSAEYGPFGKTNRSVLDKGSNSFFGKFHESGSVELTWNNPYSRGDLCDWNHSVGSTMDHCPWEWDGKHNEAMEVKLEWKDSDPALMRLRKALQTVYTSLFTSVDSKQPVDSEQI